ncbi:rhox homeobox family member 2-like, partial [Sigmodon hispidus]
PRRRAFRISIRAVCLLDCEDVLLQASDPESGSEIPSMKFNKVGRSSVIWMLALDHDEDQDQQYGVNSMVLNTGKKGDKKDLVESKSPEAEIDQAKSSLGALVQGKPAQEECSQEAKSAVEYREDKTEELGGEASKVSSGPLHKANHMQPGHKWSAQQQLKEEIVKPEDIRNLQAWARLIFLYLQRFTYSQLQDLENYFQKTHYPRFSARIGFESGEPFSGERVECQRFPMNQLLLRTTIPEDFGAAPEFHSSREA